MNSLGWFVMTIILIGTTTCSVALLRSDESSNRIRLSKACFEQTKEKSCWELK